MTQRLRGVIDGRTAGKFGVSSSGADWCVKALHPSDPLTEVRGIPDHSAVPSLLMNYQATHTLRCDPAAAGSWEFDACLLPHVIAPMYFDVRDNIVPLGLETQLMNPQIDGALHVDKYASFIAMAQRWRLAYMSVTVYQDGPDLANQGTIAVSQPPVSPRRIPLSQSMATGSTVIAAPMGVVYTAEDHPSFITSQSMPNAYINRSREGAYVPLKLTETCQDWLSEEDSVCYPNGSFTTNPGCFTLHNSQVDQFPLVSLPSTWVPVNGGFTTPMQAFVTTAMMNGTFAHICARNLSVQTSYTFYVRMGVEMQVSPSSSLAPQLKLSPPYDKLALDTYFSVARELKDGYPADFNDLGKIWDVISRAMRFVEPMLNVGFGPYGPLVAGATRSVRTTGDYIRKSRQANRKNMSATDKQRLTQSNANVSRRGRGSQRGPSRQGRKVVIRLADLQRQAAAAKAATGAQ